MSLRDADEVLRLCERQRERMVMNWRENGRFEVGGASSAALLIITRLGDEKLSEPRAFPCEPPEDLVALIPPEHYTEALSRVMRIMGEKCGAIGLVLCAEAWMARVDAKSVAEADSLRSEMPRSLEHQPGRIEALLMFLDHVATGTRLWTAEITRNPTKLGPWKQAPADGFGGRFKGIIQTGS